MSGTANGHPPTGDSHALGVMLEPALREQCDGRLSEIAWFKSAWQRGGAATGTATWRLDDGSAIDVMVKLPVGPVEYRWTTALGTIPPEAWGTPEAAACPTPRVVGSGLTIGGYDLAWLVMEKLDGHTLQADLSGESIVDLLRAVATFHDRAGTASGGAAGGGQGTERPAPAPDWGDLLAKAREAVKTHGLHEGQRWNVAIKHVQKVLPKLEAKWRARPVTTWCHGDLHPGNAMRRVPIAGHNGQGGGSVGAGKRTGCCVLIDLALVHPGHWIEDAIYLERQFWGHDELLEGVKPLASLAKLRREHGLPIDDHYPALADVRRVLMAACVPAFIEREGNPKYFHAALEIIERLHHQVSR